MKVRHASANGREESGSHSQPPSGGHWGKQLLTCNQRSSSKLDNTHTAACLHQLFSTVLLFLIGDNVCCLILVPSACRIIHDNGISLPAMSSAFPPKLVVNGSTTAAAAADPQTRAFTKVLLVTSIGYVCALLAVFALINEEVQQPYMDEVFHIDQARKYCVGNFTQWNPKITTPPGLYLVTLGFLKPFSELYAFGEEEAVRICPTAMLRFVNLVFACANAYLIFVINCTLHQSDSTGSKVHPSNNTNLLLSSISLATFPLLFFFNFLFYTDPGSLFFVLLMYLFHLNRQDWMASFFGAISLLFRQTNIIWLFFVASYTSLQILTANIDKLKKKNTRTRVLNSIALQIGMSCGGYVIAGLLFLTFLVFNKGIVLGDRNAHQASIHVPQFLYFVAFCSAFGWPWTSHPSNLTSLFRLLRSEKRYVLIASYIIVAIILKNMSVAHPYLLADNRHYTFYVWRRFLSISRPIEVLLYPILYLYCACAMYFTLSQKDNLWKCLFFLSAAMSLIPQSLLEFRYFLIPFIIWRLNATTTSVKQYVMEFAFNAAIDVLTIYIFIYKKFRWEGHEGHQRFMW